MAAFFTTDALYTMSNQPYQEFDAYRAEIATRFLDSLRAGKKPFRASRSLRPFNPVTGTPYRGLASLALAVTGYADPRWVTLSQATAEDWALRPGERPTLIELPSHEGTIALASVYNLEQFDTVPPLSIPNAYSSEHTAHKSKLLMRSSGATFSHVSQEASYFSPLRDTIYLALPTEYKNDEEYSEAALVSLAHWTGHSSRMDRLYGATGDHESFAEELRAYLATWMLAEEAATPAATPSIEQVTAWLDLLDDDPEMLTSLVQDAERITDVLLNIDAAAEDRDHELALAAQALDAQALIERIAATKEPSAELLADVRLYDALHGSSHDPISAIIHQAADEHVSWREVRLAAHDLLAGQSAAKTRDTSRAQEPVELQNAIERRDEERHHKPFLVHSSPQGSSLDQVIIRGNSGKAPEFTHNGTTLDASINAPLSATPQQAERNQQAIANALSTPAGSSQLLNDITLPVSPSTADSPAEEPLTREIEPKTVKQRRTISRSYDSLER